MIATFKIAPIREDGLGIGRAFDAASKPGAGRYLKESTPIERRRFGVIVGHVRFSPLPEPSTSNPIESSKSSKGPGSTGRQRDAAGGITKPVRHNGRPGLLILGKHP